MVPLKVFRRAIVIVCPVRGFAARLVCHRAIEQTGGKVVTDNVFSTSL